MWSPIVEALNDEVEKNGCEFCNNYKKIYPICFGLNENISITDKKEITFESDECGGSTFEINYCPMCGRRL